MHTKFSSQTACRLNLNCKIEPLKHKWACVRFPSDLPTSRRPEPFGKTRSEWGSWRVCLKGDIENEGSIIIGVELHYSTFGIRIVAWGWKLRSIAPWSDSDAIRIETIEDSVAVFKDIGT